MQTDHVTYDGALDVMKEIFSDLSDDLGEDAQEFTPGARLIDLGMESISLVYLVSELQQHFGLGSRVFDDLRANDRLLKNMTVDDVITAVLNATQ